MLFRKKPGPVDYIVAGLGNPGARYSGTRHNVGFRVIDELSRRHSIPVNKNRFQAHTGTGTIGSGIGERGAKVLLIKPQTYMKLSGRSIRAASSFYKIPPERIIVVYDDIHLPVGKLRVRKKGSDGGHNGIKSIIELCGSEDFPRLKVGVGSPDDGDLVDWVTSVFVGADRQRINRVIDVAADAVEHMLTGDFDGAAGAFNGRFVE
jgi:PTH1 family peptidyl-tRNA hydrolase